MRSAPALQPAAPAAGCHAGRRWLAPLVQAVVLLVVLSVGTGQVLTARADVAADSGFAPVVSIARVQQRVAPPVVLGIARLHLTKRLIGLRRDRRGQLQVPADPRQVGWYSEGAAPGDAGAAVIVGHVDSYTGPGVFSRLGTMRRGDLIRVRRADGSRVAFRVDQVKTYGKRNFPTAAVYGSTGRPVLRLVTCGGAFDPITRHYLSNTIVFASLVAPAKAKPVKAKPVKPPVAPRLRDSVDDQRLPRGPAHRTPAAVAR
ncbi:MAG: class F sortase [Actinobacteria bacterium]|nr:class F sortase [Actinomycetota bacterium]MCA1721645.1 class F sortase [Actinomycetota bacterium]